MAAVFTGDRGDVCLHNAYRVGCLCCCAIDMRTELKEADEQARKFKGKVDDARAQLDQSDPDVENRCRLHERLGDALDHLETWTARATALEKRADLLDRGVRDLSDILILCIGSPELAAVFEAKAVEKERELRTLKKAWSESRDEDFVEFKRQDPECDVQFQGLDRSKMPALPDWVLCDGNAFQMLLMAGRKIGRLPPQGMGEDAGLDIMPYGVALTKFGVPADPGNDWRQKPEPSKEKTDEDDIVAGMKECGMVNQVRTEHEHRMQQEGPAPVKSFLSEKEQWKLFGERKLMLHASLIANQYAKLVREKDASSQEDASASGTETVAGDGWPAVTDASFAGLTNWIAEVDARFASNTLNKWHDENKSRSKAIKAALDKWQPPPGYDWGSSTKPDPRKYYDADITIDEEDRIQLGYTVSGKKDR